MRSRTKKQFSSSWNAYRKLTTNGWSIYSGINSLKVWTVGTGTDLFQQAAFLDDVGNSLHLDTFRLVYVLERIQLPCLLVLDDSDLNREEMMSGKKAVERDEAGADLAEGTLSDAAEEDEVEEIDVAVKVDGLDRVANERPAQGAAEGEKEPAWGRQQTAPIYRRFRREGRLWGGRKVK